MNIAIIVRRLDGKGGTQRQVLILAHELIKRGHTLRLYTLRFNAERCYPELSSGLHIISLDAVLTGLPKQWAGFLGHISGFLQETYLAKRLSLLIDRDIELLNPHDSVAYRVAYFFKKQEAPHQNKFGTGQAKSKKYVPSVWVMNDVPALRWTYDRIGAFEPVRLSFFRRFIIRILDWYDRRKFITDQDVIAVLDHFNQGLVRKYLGRESVITRLGIDADHFSFVPHAPPSTSRLKLLAVGIFFPHRRFEDAIEAIAILRGRGHNATLTIIGNPNPAPAYAEHIRTLVAERGLQAYIFFAGEVSESELIRAYREHDAFVFTNYLQTWGHVPLEAMATGIPAIVSKGAGVHEVLTDGETALLVSPRSPKDIASAVERLLADPVLHEKLVRQGSAFVRENLTWPKYADAMLQLFRNVLKK